MRSEFHPPHVYEENACYFITARTVRGQRLLDSDAKRALLGAILPQCVEQYGITLYAWVILANHYHLLLWLRGSAPLYAFIRTLHAKTALQVNKLDGIPGRKVWYQYWDHFARTERAFWSCFNYIHINPMKHGYVQAATGALTVKGGNVTIELSRAPDVHECLAGYPYSSYHHYVRRYGTEFLTDAWMRYPIPDYFAGMEAGE